MGQRPATLRTYARQSSFDDTRQASLESARPNLATGPDAATSTPPTSFHIFKAAGLFSRGAIVTGDVKDDIQYYLCHPFKWSGRWDITLHQGGKDGPSAGSISKGPGKFSNTLEVALASGWSSKLEKKGLFSPKHTFVALDGSTEYEWKKTSCWTGNCTCINTSNNDVVATWRATPLTTMKKGVLSISSDYVTECEPIIITGIAIEEWWREQGGGG